MLCRLIATLSRILERFLSIRELLDTASAVDVLRSAPVPARQNVLEPFVSGLLRPRRALRGGVKYYA